MDSKCACAAPPVRCRKLTFVIVKIHHSIKTSFLARFENFAYQWIAQIIPFNLRSILILSDHIYIIKFLITIKHVSSGQQFSFTCLREGIQKNRYKKVSLKLCQKHPNIILKHPWKFQLQTFADLIVRAILVSRCLAPGPPPDRHRNLWLNACLGTSWPGTREAGEGHRGKLVPQHGSFGSSAPPPLTLVCRCRSFIFRFVFAHEVVPPQK